MALSLFLLALVSICHGVPCSSPHRYEVSFVPNFPSGSFWNLNRPMGVTVDFLQFVYVTHDSTFSLFSTGSPVSAGVAEYLINENNSTLIAELELLVGTSILDQQTYPATGVILDTYQVNDIHHLRGTVLVDLAHPFVSVISKLRPSGDWFVGLDSQPLCVNGSWVHADANASPYNGGVRNSTNANPFLAPYVDLVPPQNVSEFTCPVTVATDQFCHINSPAVIELGHFGFAPSETVCTGYSEYVVAAFGFFDTPLLPSSNKYSFKAMSAHTSNFEYFNNQSTLNDANLAELLVTAGSDTYRVNVVRPAFRRYDVSFLTVSISTKFAASSRWSSMADVFATSAHDTVSFISGVKADTGLAPASVFMASSASGLCQNGVYGRLKSDVYLYEMGNYTYANPTLTIHDSPPQPFVRAQCAGSSNELYAPYCLGTGDIPPVGIMMAAPRIRTCTTGKFPGTLYTVVFAGNWLPTPLPVAYPPYAHFSPMVVVSHDDIFSLFALGVNASVGVQSVAETGNSTTLLAELAAQQNLGHVLDYTVSGGSVSGDAALAAPEVWVDGAHPFISIIFMLAPSPDWFGGAMIDTCSANNFGAWESPKHDVMVYDAGTDAGTTFSSLNAPLTTHVPVSMLGCGTGVFCNGNASSFSVGTLSATRRDFYGFTDCIGTRLYRVTLTTTWDTSPTNASFPVGGVLDSIIVVSHTAGTFPLFQSGAASSVYPEFGMWAANGSANVEALANSLNAASNTNVLQASWTAMDSGTARGGILIADVIVDGGHTQISIAARFKPSPDWFVGVVGVEMCPGAIPPLFVTPNPTFDVYTAGVRDGSTFETVGNVVSTNIALILCNGPFCTGGLAIPTLATATFTDPPLQTFAPSTTPTTSMPSKTPTKMPSSTPITMPPTHGPSISPSTSQPTDSPSSSPVTLDPTKMPSSSPSVSPSTNQPSKSPSTSPSISPSTNQPSTSPLTSSPTTSQPSTSPSSSPSISPSTSQPSTTPSSSPTGTPSTSNPSTTPSKSPTSTPSTADPSTTPSTGPTATPSTAGPSTTPSTSPSTSPSTNTPSTSPSMSPSTSPSTNAPSTTSPSAAPTQTLRTGCDLPPSNFTQVGNSGIFVHVEVVNTTKYVAQAIGPRDVWFAVGAGANPYAGMAGAVAIIYIPKNGNVAEDIRVWKLTGNAKPADPADVVDTPTTVQSSLQNGMRRLCIVGDKNKVAQLAGSFNPIWAKGMGLSFAAHANVAAKGAGPAKTGSTLSPIPVVTPAPAADASRLMYLVSVIVTVISLALL